MAELFQFHSAQAIAVEGSTFTITVQLAGETLLYYLADIVNFSLTT